MNEVTVFASVLCGGLLWWFIAKREVAPRYKKKAVLTGDEIDFFHRLQRALPECLVCPKLAASALIEPMGIGKARQAALERIAGKKVGYAVFDAQMQLLAVVELRHRERLTRRDVAWDRYFSKAGITIVRFNVKHLPSEVTIRSGIYSRPGPQPGNATSWTGAAEVDVIEFRLPETPWRNTANVHL